MTDVVLPDSEVFQRFLAAADEGKMETDADQVSIDIIARILEASDAAGVLGREEAAHARDVLDVPLMLRDVRFNRSTFEDSTTAFYSLLDCVNVDGEPVLVTCGAKNVIAQAWRLKDLGALPIAVVLREAPKETAAGYKPMWLEAGPESF